ncbi:MAG: GAF domain-containing protein, partial [Cyanobacteria bacterium P01_G01_bin.49]
STLALGTLAVGIIVVLIAISLTKRFITPILRATKAVEKIGRGEWDTKLNIVGEDELALLGTNINQMARQLKDLAQQQTNLVEQSRWLAKISGVVAVNEEDIATLFDQTLREAKEILGVDRIVIYRFNNDWSGYIVSEAVSPGWPIALNDQINDPCIAKELLEAYKQGRVVPTNDVSDAGFHPEHQQLMTRLQIKANLVVPVINQGQLFGLLIAHHCATTYEWQAGEINFMQQLAAQLGSVLDRVTLLENQAAESRRSKLLKDLVLKLMGSTEPSTIFKTAVGEIRQAIQSDRVIIYEFDQDWKGTITAESVNPKYPQALGAQIADPCFAENYVNKYRQGRVQATTNIYNAGLTQCHLQQLEPFMVKANLVAPIVVSGQLLGLLIAHQCASPRHWQQPEIDFMTQAAIQIGVILERVNLLQQQAAAEEEQRLAKETLETRALDLLIEVEPLNQGDLTIRAKVTEDQIGTIADSYNATIENLQRIVGQVQTTIQKLSTTTEDSDALIHSLTDEALRQVAQITLASDRLTTMTRSVNLAAQNAEETRMAFQQASQSVLAGETSMNQTVDSMIAIKETVTESAKKVQQLGESSQKISKVVSLIGRFAAQTHLLALKASIEAARAGEEGRGFAVIADEVRTLAAQSAEATADIETLVGSIQTGTRDVAKTMETGTEQVLMGTQLVEETRKSLTQITIASNQINHLVESITQATIEQSTTSNSVNEVMTEVSLIAENSSISAAHLYDSFQELLAIAQQLKGSVEQFKV